MVGLREYLPLDHIVFPTAFPEPAVVVDNADPKKQGRVKVRYFWQDPDDTTATTGWMLVQTPDAGSSDAVKKSRGFTFIPEKGDHVMIGFRQGAPSRPFVMGSIYHQDNTNGMAEKNTVKSIVTRSGHTIELNDDEEGDWGITLKDNEGNSI